jgi:hypothetical protein
MDRAVAAWAETSGGAESPYTSAKLLAAEVVGLEFQYYDGVDWVYEWDSATTKTLPRIIKIWLEIQPTYALTEAGLAQQSTNKEPPRQSFYYFVTLPSAPVVPPPPADETATDAASAAGSTGQSTAASGAAPGAMP